MVASVSLSGMGLGCGLGTGNLERNSPGDYSLQPRKDHWFRGREMRGIQQREVRWG